MWRLTDRIVRSTLVTACRLATSPTRTSPFLANATTEGVVRAPSALAMTVGSPPSRTATTEFVVPRSIPTARAMFCYLHVCWLTRPRESCGGGRVSSVSNKLSRFNSTLTPGRTRRPGPAFPLRATSSADGDDHDVRGPVGVRVVHAERVAPGVGRADPGLEGAAAHGGGDRELGPPTRVLPLDLQRDALAVDVHAVEVDPAPRRHPLR